MSFREIYDKALLDADREYSTEGNIFDRPSVTTGLISPNCPVVINSIMSIGLIMDKDGMIDLIDKFQEKWDLKDRGIDFFAENIILIQWFVNNYLCGNVSKGDRENSYSCADGYLKLSDIAGKNISACAEKAAVGHQLFTILEKAGMSEFKSYIVNSFCFAGEQSLGQHSVIVLRHKNLLSYNMIYDITYPLYVEDGVEKGLHPALYIINEEQYNDLVEGKGVEPQSVYEQMGLSVQGEQRLYGLNFKTRWDRKSGGSSKK